MTIEQALKKKAEALVKADIDFLKEFLADSFVYINSQAKVLQKKDYIDMVKVGRIKWLRQEVKVEQQDVRGDMAYVFTTATDWMRSAGKEFQTRFRQLLVFTKEGDEWRWLAGQSTQLPTNIRE